MKPHNPTAAPKMDRSAAGIPCSPADGGVQNPCTLGDLRYRKLMGPAAWGALKPAVRHRFSHRLAGGESLVYSGQTIETRLSPLGHLLVTAARLIGAPFPLRAYAAGEPTVVTVTEDKASQGQFWTRLYGWGRGFPQIVHSSKRFAGPTGLEEYVGYGVSVALTLHEEDGALVFRSAGYFLSVLSLRLRLPHWLSPGALAVRHRDLGQSRFRFDLNLHHPVFGSLLQQAAVFRDPGEAFAPVSEDQGTRSDHVLTEPLRGCAKTCESDRHQTVRADSPGWVDR